MRPFHAISCGGRTPVRASSRRLTRPGMRVLASSGKGLATFGKWMASVGHILASVWPLLATIGPLRLVIGFEVIAFGFLLLATISRKKTLGRGICETREKD